MFRRICTIKTSKVNGAKYEKDLDLYNFKKVKKLKSF